MAPVRFLNARTSVTDRNDVALDGDDHGRCGSCQVQPTGCVGISRSDNTNVVLLGPMSARSALHPFLPHMAAPWLAN